MKKYSTVSFFLLLALSKICSGQDVVNPKSLSIGAITSQYTTYSQLLADPKVIYNKGGCEVTNFTIGIMAQNKAFYGPYKTTGAALSAQVKEILEKQRGTHCDIYIDSVRVSCNGKNTLLGAQLFYSCK